MTSLQAVSSARGDSVIYEEYKGNYREARQLGEQLLLSAQQQNDKSLLADALLELGIVLTLQGDLRQGRSYLDQIQSLVSDDHTRSLRALTFINQNEMLQYNIFPGWKSASSAEIDLKWSGVEFLKAFQSHIELHRKRADIAARLEERLLTETIHGLRTARNVFAASFNMSAPDSLLDVEPFFPSPEVRQLVETIGNPGLRFYLERLIAEIFAAALKHQQGQAYLENALTDYETVEDLAGKAACYLVFGDWLCASTTSPEALGLLIADQSASGGIASLQSAEMELILHKQGIDSEQFDAARTAYDDAEFLFLQTSNRRGVAAIHLRRGYLWSLTANYEAALLEAKAACDLYREVGDYFGYNLALAHMILHSIGKGLLPERSDIAQEIGKWGATEGSVSYALGIGVLFSRVGFHWLNKEGDYERALACFRLQEALCISLGMPANRTQSMVFQAKIFQLLGEFNAATDLYERALDRIEADIKNDPQIANVTGSQMGFIAMDLGILYNAQRNGSGLRRLLSRARQAESKGDLFLQSFVDWGRSMSDDFARVNIPVFEAIKARDEGDDDLAARLFDEALSIAKNASKNNTDLLQAIVHGHQKQVELALLALNRYLSSQGDGMMKVIEKINPTLFKQHRVSRLMQAVALSVRIDAFTQAYNYLQELEKVAGPNWWQTETYPWDSLFDCGEIYEGKADISKALACYNDAIKLFEDRRSALGRDEYKTAFANGAQDLYFAAAHAISQLAIPDSAVRAFHYAERGKSRALLDLMVGHDIALFAIRDVTVRAWRQHNARLTLRRSLMANERNKPTPDKTRIEELRLQIEEDERTLNETERELAASNPNFFSMFSNEAKVLSIDEVRELLPEDTLLIEYVFFGEKFLAWAVDKSGLVQFYSISLDSKVLTRKIRQFIHVCSEAKATEALANELSGFFFSPFAENIQKYENLVFVPYGAGHALPFHALPFKGKPLIYSHAVSYLPSASVLQFLPKVKSPFAMDTCFVIGNPTKNLKDAEIEAQEIARLFHTEPILNEKATKDTILAQIESHSVLHFATHGQMNTDAPLSSAISLANGEKLALYELMGLHLRSPLVVLSACETGKGETTQGDDVLGFTRSLLGCGAGKVVVSLWKVNDLFTRLLMTEFYKELLRGTSPSKALRLAQNIVRTLPSEVIKREEKRLRHILTVNEVSDSDIVLDYDHPFYWAPFVMIGL